jgi:hypothetical protein
MPFALVVFGYGIDSVDTVDCCFKGEEDREFTSNGPQFAAASLCLLRHIGGERTRFR